MIDINAGDELAVAAAKTYTAELGAIAMLSTALGSSERQRVQLSAIPDAIPEILRMNEVIGRVAPRYRL